MKTCPIKSIWNSRIKDTKIITKKIITTINSISIAIHIIAFSVLGFSSISYGAPNCPICLTETQQGEETIQCSQGHVTHQECLNNQIKSTDDIRELRTTGLRCCGLNSSHSSDYSATQCNNTFSLDEIYRALRASQINKLEKRLSKAFESTDKSLAKREFWRLSQGIQDAFNLSCPAEGCGGCLAPIEGCNAAKCSDSDCNTIFCYLCLERQDNSESAHAHVKEHSGDFWDYRPGYIERYHWLLARTDLAFLFKKKVDPTVRDAVLVANQAMLIERNMWPFPAGKKTANWTQEVRSNTELTLEKKIELLQNEAIYQRKMNNPQNTILVDAEIQRLGGIVLASLDLRDEAGVYPQPRRRVERPVVVQAPAAQAEVAQAPRVQLIPVEANDARVSREFAALGNMYQVENLIWSGVAERRMSFGDANRYCERLGGQRGFFTRARGEARLPTPVEYETLARAMGRDTARGYNPNLLPDMRNNWFWTSTAHAFSGGLAHAFEGISGVVGIASRFQEYPVRCIQTVPHVRH